MSPDAHRFLNHKIGMFQDCGRHNGNCKAGIFNWNWARKLPGVRPCDKRRAKE